MRRTALAVVLAVVLGMLVPPASAAAVTWRRIAGIQLASVAVANDGSIYVAGARRVSITVEATLVKYRPDGVRLWTRTWLPFVEASTAGIAVDVAPNGNVAFLGSAHGACEGGGWFLEVVEPDGDLVHRYVTPGWECGIAQTATDVAASNDVIAVSGMDHGCCADPYRNGWVRGFGPDGLPRWRSNFEPPATTPRRWFDRASGVALGDGGNLYATGWAATEFVDSEQYLIEGTPVLMKLASDGSRIFTRRLHVAMRVPDDPVAVSVRAGGVMVTAAVRGRGLDWRTSRPTEGWLASLSKDGDLRWTRTWASGGMHGAVPAGVAIGPGQETWVVGTQRDVAHHDLDLFVRRYAPGGRLQGAMLLDGGVPNLNGTDVAIGRLGAAFVSGFVGRPFSTHGGRLWRITP